jgi:hypothetical protein
MLESPDSDLADVLHAFTNYVMNERVRSYNEGVDAERERCAKICGEGAAKNEGDTAAALMTAADLIRNPVE